MTTEEVCGCDEDGNASSKSDRSGCTGQNERNTRKKTTITKRSTQKPIIHDLSRAEEGETKEDVHGQDENEHIGSKSDRTTGYKRQKTRNTK